MLWHRFWGEPKNPTLIFFHGFMGTHGDFKPIIKNLQKDYFCIALDLPGHGFSKSFLPSTACEFDKLILETIEPYTHNDYTLIGYSMGGRIALKLLKNLKPNALALISAKIFPLTIQEQKKRSEKDHIQSLEMQDLPFLNFLTNWYNLPLFKTLDKKQKLLRQMIEERQQQSPQALSHILKLVSPASYSVNRQVLHELQCPLLYCAGIEDEKYYRQIQEIKDQKKDLWLAAFSGASHALHLERANDFAQTLKQFNRYYYDRLETTSPF
ncbi:MAG: 2-succinyl-6-hydroxy-2,4-cyclohexadiene-1-carboxylate synthase [Chlamydiae bacterium]|nr:2-succinyl-6-hydroxy-2,4-cyclohexadiene-1-carboxylate synthase [Chlamydiota bacterium]